MASTGFEITVTAKNPGVLPEIQSRLANLTTVFNNIIDEWAKGNSRKFSDGKGQSLSGAEISGQVWWEPLSDNYYIQKQKQGYEDWLMHRTGALEYAMSSPDGFLRDVGAQAAEWGIPIDQMERNKLQGNASRRKVNFFDRTDQLAIKREITNYLTFGDNYKEILFERGLMAKYAKQSAKWEMAW